MSKAVNTNDPRYSKLTIGVCPDQWGVWFPEDPKQMDPRQAWEEMVSLEYLGSLVLTALDIVVSFVRRSPNRFGCDIQCTPLPTNNLGVCTNK